MTLWAIVPVKPLKAGKSRLAEVLNQNERVDLNRRLLSHTLEVLKSIPELEHVLVTSRDPAVLALARDLGARTVLEDATARLNLALARATVVAGNFNVRGVLVLPADLPMITNRDIYTILERAHDPPVVVIAPDHRQQGTNALLVCPTGMINYKFGPQSFMIHCDGARQAGARLEVVKLISLAYDVDLPEDLDRASQVLGRVFD